MMFSRRTIVHWIPRLVGVSGTLLAWACTGGAITELSTTEETSSHGSATKSGGAERVEWIEWAE